MITKAIIAFAAAFAVNVQARPITTLPDLYQALGTSVAAAALVWYVPNTPKGEATP
jgi:hypothetical protein